MSGVAFSLTTEGLLDPLRLSAWTKERQAEIYRATARAMRGHGREVAGRVENQAAAVLKIKRRTFPNITSKVYASRADAVPMLRIYSRVPWLGIHERGGVITGRRGKLLIPLIRIGYKAFRRVVTTILRSGAGFFKEVNGRVLLFAEYQPEYGRPLARFRRFERQQRGGAMVRRGDDIPIAVLVDQVTLPKRIKLEQIVKQSLPALAAAIEREV